MIRTPVKLLDTTLREGEQTPNVSFRLDDKIKIAQMLDRFGVEFIELGHPAVSPDVREAVLHLAQLETSAEKLVHARALPADIDEAARSGAPWVGIFLGTSPLSLRYKFDIDEETALRRIRDAVCYAKDCGLKVRFTAEDATRTEPNFLLEVAQAAEDAGADRMSLPDTVGTMAPGALAGIVNRVTEVVGIPVHVHCHNDFGMAAANTMAGLEAGAQLADVSVNGLGERSGIAALAEVAVALKVLYGVSNSWRLEMLPDLSRAVERASGVFNSENRPVVGMYAFTHKAGLHSRAVLRDPRTYEAFPPELVKRHREVTIDKYTGRDAVRARLEEMNIEASEGQLNRIIEIIKGRPEKRRFSDVDLLEIADDVLELEVRAAVPLHVEAIVRMALSSAQYTTRISRRLIGFSQVKEVYEITGEDDVIAHVIAPSIGDLNEFIEEVRVSEGIERTSTQLILKGYGKDAD